MLEAIQISCPYCGARFDTAVDGSAGDQEYIEDCFVCCRPIVFQVHIGYEGRLNRLEVRRDDE